MIHEKNQGSSHKSEISITNYSLYKHNRLFLLFLVHSRHHQKTWPSQNLVQFFVMILLDIEYNHTGTLTLRTKCSLFYKLSPHNIYHDNLSTYENRTLDY